MYTLCNFNIWCQKKSLNLFLKKITNKSKKKNYHYDALIKSSLAISKIFSILEKKVTNN